MSTDASPDKTASEDDYDNEWDEDFESQLTQLEQNHTGAAPTAVNSTALPPHTINHIDLTIDEFDTVSSSQTSEQRRTLDEALKILETGQTESLWQKFRSKKGWGALSVTDLVSPTWCEYQRK